MSDNETFDSQGNQVWLTLTVNVVPIALEADACGIAVDYMQSIGHSGDDPLPTLLSPDGSAPATHRACFLPAYTDQAAAMGEFCRGYSSDVTEHGVQPFLGPLPERFAVMTELDPAVIADRTPTELKTAWLSAHDLREVV